MSEKSLQKDVCPESTVESANRRNFIKKAALATAGAAIGSSALSRAALPESSGASSTAVTTCTANSPQTLAIWNGSSSLTDVVCKVGVSLTGTVSYDGCCCQVPASLNVNNLGTGVGLYVTAPICAAIVGNANASGTGCGVMGISKSGVGVYGESGTGTGVFARAYCSKGVPLVAMGICTACVHQSANLQEWQKGCDTSVKTLSVVNKCGWLGIGTSSPTSALEVHGTAFMTQTAKCCLTPTLCVNNLGCGPAISAGASAYQVAIKGLAPSTGIGLYGNGGIGVIAVANKACSIPLVVQGASCQTGNLQRWEAGVSHAVKSVVNSCGWFGIGTCSPGAPLSVIGSPTSTPPVIGTFKSNSSAKDKSTLIQLQNNDTTVVDWNIGVAGKCNSSGVTDGSLYFQHPGVSAIPLSINKCGYVGINNANPIRRLCITGRIQASCGVGVGTQTINTTLAVNGSIAAKTRVATNSCEAKMTASDFALLAKCVPTVTLPPANTENGMIVFVKNIGSSTVAVSPKTGCKIDLATSSISLSASPHQGVTLVSDGTTNWYVQSNTLSSA